MFLFGGLTPMNVWDMTIADFHKLASVVDQRRSSMRSGG